LPCKITSEVSVVFSKTWMLGASSTAATPPLHLRPWHPLGVDDPPHPVRGLAPHDELPVAAVELRADADQLAHGVRPSLVRIATQARRTARPGLDRVLLMQLGRVRRQQRHRNPPCA